MKKIYLVLPLLILGCSDTNFNYPESEKKPLSNITTPAEINKKTATSRYKKYLTIVIYFL